MIHSFTWPPSKQSVSPSFVSKKSKMNIDMVEKLPSEKYKGIIEDNKTLLVKNIILTDEFFETMVRHKMTNSMVEDVKRNETREKRNGRFLEMCPLRCARMFSTLCDTLQVTGHTMLADHLREEAADVKSQREDKDLYRLIPALQTSLDHREKCTLQTYITQKIKEAIQKQTWKNGATDKQKAMEAKRQQIEQAGNFKEKLTEKEKQLFEMQAQLENLRQECRAKDLQINQFQGMMQKATSELKEDYNKQIKFSIATNSDNKRLQERLGMFNQEIRKMNVQARECLLEKGEDSDVMPEMIGSDPDNIKVSYLAKNIQRLINKIRELTAKMEKRREFYESDRLATLKTLNVSDDKQSTHDAAERFVRRVESDCKALVIEVFQVSDILSSGETHMVRASQRSLRNETAPPLEKTKVEISIINDQIQHLLNLISSQSREIQQQYKNERNLETQIKQLSEKNKQFERQLKEQKPNFGTLLVADGLNAKHPSHDETFKLPPLQKIPIRQQNPKSTKVTNILFDEGITRAKKSGFKGYQKGFHKFNI